MSNLNQLPSRENTLFRSLVSCYELQQYKKGIKTADQILKKYPNHGETLSMKGLLLNCLKKKEEAYEYARLALKNNLKSHICWHVYGLLYRSDQNYNEAIKCYVNALKIDPENSQILRDLYLLQIQVRDLKGYAETRRILLTLRSNIKVNWIGFSIGHYLNHNYELSLCILDTYINTIHLNNTENNNYIMKYELSEMYIYRNILIYKLGNIDKAINDLYNNKNKILDKIYFLEKLGLYYILLNEFKKGFDVYIELLNNNNTNYKYHNGIQSCVLENNKYILSLKEYELPSSFYLNTLTINEKNKLIHLYKNELPLLIKENEYDNKSCHLYTKILLDLNDTNINEFKLILKDYLYNQLKKGVPSLGSELEKYYNDNDNSNITTTNNNNNNNISNNNSNNNNNNNSSRNNNKNNNKNNSNNNSNSSNNSDNINHSNNSNNSNNNKNNSKVKIIQELLDLFIKEYSNDKDIILWTNYLFAQHYNNLDRSDQAFTYIDKCIKENPSILEFYEKKATFYKKYGQYENAILTVNVGREKDLKDRYLNNLTVKYLLKYSYDNEKAKEVISLFAKQEGGDSDMYLYDMQCIWYEILCANSYYNNNKLNLALKNYYNVIKHYNDIRDDEFDFHSYGIRRMTLRAYIQILDFENTIYNTKYYMKAVFGIIKCYLDLYDIKNNYISIFHKLWISIYSNVNKINNINVQKLNEITKLQEKNKKIIVKDNDNDIDVLSTNINNISLKNNNKKDTMAKKQQKKRIQQEIQNKKKDNDPNGLLLLEKNPLDESIKLLNTIKDNNNINNKYLNEWKYYTYDIYIRRKKYLKSLHALKYLNYYNIKSNNLDDPFYFIRMIDFYYHILLNNDIFMKLNTILQHILIKEMHLLMSIDSIHNTKPTIKLLESYINNYKNKYENKSLIHRAMIADGMILLNNNKDIILSTLAYSLDLTNIKNDKKNTLLKDCIFMKHFIYKKLNDIIKNNNYIKENDIILKFLENCKYKLPLASDLFSL